MDHIDIKRVYFKEDPVITIESYLKLIKLRPPKNYQEEMEKFVKYVWVSKESHSPTDVLKALSRLLGPKIVEVNFFRFMDLFPPSTNFEIEALRMICTKATKISQFNIFPLYCEAKNPIKIERDMWSKIRKMKSLRKVEIEDFYFDLENLMAMSKKLKNLRQLAVRLDPSINPNTTFETKRFRRKLHTSFSQLTSFLFTSLWRNEIDGNELQYKLTKYCVQYLSKLEHVGSEECLYDMSTWGNDIKKKKKKSNIRQLNLLMDTFERNACSVEIFAYVESLYIDCSPAYEVQQNEYAPHSKFSNLLRTYAETLKKLTITRTEKLDMRAVYNYIVRSCPNLESLHIYGTKFDFKEINLQKLFMKLENLYVVFSNDSSDICLPNLLLVTPALVKVHLSQAKVSVKDLKKTSRLVSAKKVLRNINDFKMKLKVDPSIEEEVRNELIDLRKEMLKNRRDARFDCKILD